jgi:hypothetical protein
VLRKELLYTLGALGKEVKKERTYGITLGLLGLQLQAHQPAKSTVCIGVTVAYVSAFDGYFGVNEFAFVIQSKQFRGGVCVDRHSGHRHVYLAAL